MTQAQELKFSSLAPIIRKAIDSAVPIIPSAVERLGSGERQICGASGAAKRVKQVNLWFSKRLFQQIR